MKPAQKLKTVATVQALGNTWLLCLLVCFFLLACPFHFEDPFAGSPPPPAPKVPYVRTFAGNPPCNDNPEDYGPKTPQGAYADGPAHLAQFNEPTHLAVDVQGNLFVADIGNFRIRKITPEGMVSTVAGNGKRDQLDGVGMDAGFGSVNGIAVDTVGNLYVSEGGSIRKITPEGVVSTLQLTELDDTEPKTGFSSPLGLATDANGNLYVVDSGNHRIRKVTPSSVVSTLAGSGEISLKDGVGAAASFSYPRHVAMGTDGNLYVGDGTYSHIRKVTMEGEVITFAGKFNFSTIGRTCCKNSDYSCCGDGVGAKAGFNSLRNLTASPDGNLYVTDNHFIRKVTMQRAVTTLGGGSFSGSGCAILRKSDGPLEQATFSNPNGIAAAPDGSLYVADVDSHRIRKITWE